MLREYSLAHALADALALEEEEANDKTDTEVANTYEEPCGNQGATPASTRARTSTNTSRTEAHFIGEEAEGRDKDTGNHETQMSESTHWGYPIIVPSTGAGDFWTPNDHEQAQVRTTRMGWLSGLDALEELNSREWATLGYTAGRRIPTEFRVPIPQHHHEHLPATRRGGK